MTERTCTPPSRRAREMPEEEDSKHLSTPEAVHAQPVPADIPPPVNVDLDVVRAEFQLLAETAPEVLIKGLMLECRELVRGTANVICDPKYLKLQDDYFHMLKGTVELSAQLAEAIARLRQGGAVEERCQRIIVERIERGPALAAPGGEGGIGLLKNE